MSVAAHTAQQRATQQGRSKQQHALAPTVRRGSPLAERAKGLRERAWWVMRERRKFTLNLLLETLADGGEKDAPGNLLKYIHQLERVGVLVRSKHRQAATPGLVGSTGHTVWVLVRDLGRHAPVWRRAAAALWDPNSQTVVPPADAPVAVQGEGV